MRHRAFNPRGGGKAHGARYHDRAMDGSERGHADGQVEVLSAMLPAIKGGKIARDGDKRNARRGQRRVIGPLAKTGPYSRLAANGFEGGHDIRLCLDVLGTLRGRQAELFRRDKNPERGGIDNTHR